MDGFSPKALIVIVPVPVAPPQSPAYRYASSCVLLAPLAGIISTTFEVLVTLLLDTVYVYGGSEPLQLELLNVTFWILLFISAHRVLGLSLWGLGPTLIQNSKIQSVTLSASAWSGSTAPFTYVIGLSSIGLTGNSQIDISPGVNASNDQYKALLAASLCGGSISGSNLTIKAFGQKPSINIPIVITVREG